MSRLPADTLDAILALQVTVAWAGEKPRLGWWRTDILDEAGARDLLARLTPRTVEWTAFEAVREAARRADERMRQRSATPDRARTLFHFGFELDEHLAERLADHKRGHCAPADVFAKHWGVEKQFDRRRFEAWCTKAQARP